jgi:hypothetical protein
VTDLRSSLWFGIALGGVALALGGGCQPEGTVAPAGPRVLWVYDDPACHEQCDAYGTNCVFPTYVCGVQGCDIDGGTNLLSPQACDGKGSCAGYAPSTCAGHLTCADEEKCRTSCSASADCLAGYACSGGDCIPTN